MCCLCHGPCVPGTDDRLLLGGYYGAYQPLGFRLALTQERHCSSSSITPSQCCLISNASGFLTLSDQHFLSCATTLATSQLFHPALSRPFSTVLLQVVFGLPPALQHSRVHLNAVKESFSPSLRSM